jgi:hypothetical protein
MHVLRRINVEYGEFLKSYPFNHALQNDIMKWRQKTTLRVFGVSFFANVIRTRDPVACTFSRFPDYSTGRDGLMM